MLTIPLLEDDYPNLWQAQQLGSPAEALALLHNPVFRLRATSFWIMYLLWQVGNLAPVVLPPGESAAAHRQYLAAVRDMPGVAADARRGLLGGSLFRRGRGSPGSGDVVFGHQRTAAVSVRHGRAMVLAELRGARPELGTATGGVGLFALALLSKESAVVILPLLAAGRRAQGSGGGRRSAWFPTWRWRRWRWRTVAASRSISFRFYRRQLQPARAVLDHLAAQLLAGVVDLGPGGGGRRSAGARPCAPPVGARWRWRGSGSALAPYSFLTYSTPDSQPPDVPGQRRPGDAGGPGDGALASARGSRRGGWRR